MSKVLLLNDLHFGIKADSPVFKTYVRKFLQEQLFPYIEKEGIKTIIFLGDFLDKRKYVNIETLRFTKTEFFKPLRNMGVEMHMILGNHDIVFRNTSEVNSTIELYSHYDNIHIYDNPCDVIIEGCQVAMIPWLNEGNTEKFRDFVKNSTSLLAFGHFELQGFQVLRGILCDHGLDKSEISKFHRVFSGHFHQKHDDGQIFYLGTQYDMTFSDVDERKGFHVVDILTGELEFIENPNKIFHRIVYDDTVTIPKYDYSKYKDTYVKFIIRKKNNPKELDKIIQMFYQSNLAEFNIIEEIDLFVEDNEVAYETADTVTMICNEIEKLENSNTDKLKVIINELYNESYDISGDEE